MRKFLLAILVTVHVFSVSAQTRQTTNKPERVAWFQDLSFGMFIHWNVDVTLGTVISHSLSGASDDYVNRYISELPKHFNPKKFDPDEWATLAKLAGMKYVVFTAKHHSGFCMFNTKTTPFNVMNTPFGRDITKELITAFRKQGIAIGLYISPEDFYFLHQHNIPIGRLQHPLHSPVNNPELLAYDKQQVKELLTQYGKSTLCFSTAPPMGCANTPGH